MMFLLLLLAYQHHHHHHHQSNRFVAFVVVLFVLSARGRHTRDVATANRRGNDETRTFLKKNQDNGNLL
jgi:hypothetical protein